MRFSSPWRSIAEPNQSVNGEYHQFGRAKWPQRMLRCDAAATRFVLTGLQPTNIHYGTFSERNSGAPVANGKRLDRASLWTKIATSIEISPPGSAIKKL